jgi:hypothetical protein
MERSYRVEIYRPDGRWKWGQWVSGREGYGTLTDRLERAARDILATCEPAGTFARVFRHVPHDLDPVREMFTVRMPGEVGQVPPLPSQGCPCTAQADIDPDKAETLAAEMAAQWEAWQADPLIGEFIRSFHIPHVSESP